MMSPLNSHVCKRPILLAPARTKVAILLPRNINAPIGNSLGEDLFPSTLAVAGCITVLFGLKCLGQRFSDKERSAIYRESVHEAKQRQELKSETSLDSNGFSAASIASQRKERDLTALKMFVALVRPVPGLSSILQSQVFGGLKFRCIMKLKGIDVAPKNSSSCRRANEKVSTREGKPRKNERKQHKNILRQISAPINDNEGQRSEKVAKKTGPKRKLLNGKSHDCITGRPEGTKTQREAGNAGIGDPNSGGFQGRASDSNVKKSRKRPNRKPRPRHRSKAKSARNTVQEAKSATANCQDDQTSVDVAISESDTAQKRVQGLSGLKRDAQQSWKKHRPRKNYCNSASERIHSGPAEHNPDDSEPAWSGKGVNAKNSSRMQVLAEESTFSRANKPLESAVLNEEEKRGRASCKFTSQDARSDNIPGLNRPIQRLQRASRGDNPIDGVRHHPPGNPRRRMPRKYRSRRRYFDLDYPQERNT